VRLRAGVAIERAGLPPALLAAIKHSASLHNAEFCDRERRRLSTWGVPRFIRATNVEVHDYVDVDIPVLARAHSKRVTAYAGLGFPPPVRAG
jgi:hypothetical protein